MSKSNMVQHSRCFHIVWKMGHRGKVLIVNESGQSVCRCSLYCIFKLSRSLKIVKIHIILKQGRQF